MPKKMRIAGTSGATARTDGASASAARTKPSGLYLLALRSHVAQSYSPIPRRKLTIHLDPKPDAEGRPVPIKITLS